MGCLNVVVVWGEVLGEGSLNVVVVLGRCWVWAV